MPLQQSLRPGLLGAVSSQKFVSSCGSRHIQLAVVIDKSLGRLLPSAVVCSHHLVCCGFLTVVAEKQVG